MNSRSYSILGWVVWQIGSRVAKRKMASLDQLRQSIAANDLSDELNYGY